MEREKVGPVKMHRRHYADLDHPTARSREGEVQVFADFEARVSRAIAARERLYPGTSPRELLDDERRAVWTQLPTNT